MPDVRIVDDHFGLQVFKKHAEKLGAIDIETTVSDNPWIDPPQLVSVAITFDGKRVFVFRNDEFLKRAALAVIPHTKWIMHNGLFDRLMLKEFFNIDAPLVHDTMAMQYLLDPDEPKSLEYLSSKILERPAYKDVDYKNILNEPFEKVAQMNGEDACRTYDLFRPLADQLNEDKALSRVYQWILIPAINELIEITRTGIPMDGERLASVTSNAQQRTTELHRRLTEATPSPSEEVYPKGWPKPSWWRVRDLEDSSGEILEAGRGKYPEGGLFNPSSAKQVGHILFDVWGLAPLVWNTDDEGNNTSPSTNADVLLQLETYHAEGEVETWLSMLREYRKTTKLLTYFEAWPKQTDENGFLHPRYKPLHVVTGRLASENPNIQNVPRQKEVRACFGNVPGYTWLKADYSQIELRLAALAAREPTMLEAYRNGEDIHRLTAELVLGDRSDEARQSAKVLNFGLLYGAGPGTLMRIARSEYGVFLTLEEARRHRENFFSVYQNLGQWHRDMETQICATGVARSPLGRIRYLPKAKIPRSVEDMRAQKYAAVREGINHTVQSYASDLLLSSLIRVAPKVRKYEGLVVAEVHDEIDFLVPTENVSHLVPIIKNTMEDVSWLKKHGIKLGVPVVADVETGPNWGELGVPGYRIEHGFIVDDLPGEVWK